MPSSRFMAKAVAASPSRNSEAILRSRSFFWRTAVKTSGRAVLGRTRFRSAIVSPASIDWTCSRSPSILMVMPVSACSSRRRSIGRGPIWLISSTTRTVLASGRNSPVSMALRSGWSAHVSSTPASLRASACRQAVDMPTIVRPSEAHASTRGLRSVVLPDPATPVRRESLPPLPSAWMAARCSLENRMPASPASTASIARRIAASESASERSIAASLDFSATSRSIRSCSVWLNRILPSWTPKTRATELPSWMKPRFSKRSTTASTSSRPPVAPASIRPRAAWTRSRSASRTAAVWNSAESASDARA